MVISLQVFHLYTKREWNNREACKEKGRASKGNGIPLQYSCLENPMDGGAQKAAVHGVAKSRTRLSDSTFTFHFHALEKEMATHSSVLALENPMDGGAWWAAVYGVAQSQTRLKRLSSSSSNSIREDNGNPLQYSFRKIRWTEEPRRLQCMGLLRVRHK